MDKTQFVMEEANEVIEFWFSELDDSQWFAQNDAMAMARDPHGALGRNYYPRSVL